MSYEKLKIFVSEHKPQLMTVAACAIMFVVGFGTGRHSTSNISQDDYNVNSAEKPGTKQSKGTEEVGAGKTDNKPTTPTTVAKADDDQIREGAGTAPAPPVTAGRAYDPNQPCPIKGNISGSSKIYHVKGGASYEKTHPEQCFDTEAQAQAAGFRKAKR